MQYILESIDTNNEHSGIIVARGINATEFLARSAESDTNAFIPLSSQKNIAGFEEAEWLEKAITLVENWKGIPTKSMFNSLGGSPPNWLIDWEAQFDLENKP